MLCYFVLFCDKGQPSSCTGTVEHLSHSSQARFPMAKVGELDRVGVSDTERPRGGLDGGLGCAARMLPFSDVPFKRPLGFLLMMKP